MVYIWPWALGTMYLWRLTSLFTIQGVSRILIHNSWRKVPIFHWHLMLEINTILLLLQILRYLGLLSGVIYVLRIELFLEWVISALSLGFWNLELLSMWLGEAVIWAIFHLLHVHGTVFHIWLAVRSHSTFAACCDYACVSLINCDILLNVLRSYLLTIRHLLNIIDINVVYPIIEISHIQR